MKKYLAGTFLILFCTTFINAQDFNVKASGEQTFSFKDNNGRNQALFHSSAPLEDISGLSSNIDGTISFNIDDVAKTLRGKITIPAASLKSGIERRDEHLRGEGWLNAEKYPEISFTINKVGKVEKISDRKIKTKVTGDFLLHGVKKEITIDAVLTYLDENELTRKRAPGDLIGVSSVFNIKLSDFGVENKIIGQKVADNIEITVNIVGSNKTNS